MKKLLAILFVLFFTVDAWAGIITYQTLSGDAGLSFTHLNTSFNTIVNEMNGNINSDNLADGSITSDDIISNTNPLDRDFYNIGEYVYSGLTIATSATLASTITAGVAFVANDATNKLHLVVTGATAKTFTASKDTYVYVDHAGAFSYTEAANGAAQPVTPSNSIIIAKVVTDGTTVASVTDLRETTPANLRVYQDYIQGCILSRDVTTATKISVDSGEIEFGNANGKVRRNTSSVYLDCTTTGRGGLDTGTLTTGYNYVFAVADDGNDTNWELIGSTSSTDATGITGERLIGWFYADTTTVISPDAVGGWRGSGGDVLNMPKTIEKDYRRTLTGSTLTTIATLKTVTSGKPVLIYYGSNFQCANDSNNWLALSIDSAAVPGSWLGFSSNPTSNYFSGVTGVYPVQLNAGQHTIELKAYATGANTDVRQYNLIVDEK